MNITEITSVDPGRGMVTCPGCLTIQEHEGWPQACISCGESFSESSNSIHFKIPLSAAALVMNECELAKVLEHEFGADFIGIKDGCAVMVNLPCGVDYMGTRDAGRILGVSLHRVRALIGAGRLPVVRVGRDWLIKPEGLKQVWHRPKGRPKP